MCQVKVCHAELHLQSEGPSLIKTGITLLLHVQYLLDGSFPLMVSFTPEWQVSSVMYLFFLRRDCSKGWISCSKRYRKQSFLLLGFGKALIPKEAALMDFHSACCRRGGGWDCVA